MDGTDNIPEAMPGSRQPNMDQVLREVETLRLAVLVLSRQVRELAQRNNAGAGG